MKEAILQPGQSYTFCSYFELPHGADEILSELGYGFNLTSLRFPQLDASRLNFSEDHRDLQQSILTLKDFIERRLPNVRLENEASRREILISPLLLTLMDFVSIQLRIEYVLKVSEQLKGSLDYYLQSQHNLIVIEAKNADLTRGFTQLAVELIALDQWIDSDAPVLYGAVSTGDIWRFGRLSRAHKRVDQDLSLYRVPADIEDLFEILLVILTGQV